MLCSKTQKQQVHKSQMGTPCDKKGRLELRWTDEADDDARMFGIKDWWMVERDQDEWKGILEEVKIQR